MTVTVPATDYNGTLLANAVSTAQTNYNNAATVNPAQAAEYLGILTAAQVALINYLMGNAFAQTTNKGNGLGTPSYLTPAGILSSGTINT